MPSGWSTCGSATPGSALSGASSACPSGGGSRLAPLDLSSPSIREMNCAVPSSSYMDRDCPSPTTATVVFYKENCVKNLVEW